MREDVRRRHRGPAALMRNAAGGLMLGLLLGYVAAWVLPRRRPVPAGGYEAPVPERIELPVELDLRLMPGRQRTPADVRTPEPEGSR
ncbi:hypothetical protein ACPPVT_22365 [Angustibacter sp. McL0619]|uniref:hypothetical protein n=1 Tax=Angustibacter sp. McL0619 TaxID=3415676 RepID=UPI003CEF4D7F